MGKRSGGSGTVGSCCGSCGSGGGAANTKRKLSFWVVRSVSTSSFLYSLCSYDCFFGFLHLLLCFFLHFLLCTHLLYNLIQILSSPCHSRLLGRQGRRGLVLAPRQIFFFSFCSRRHSRRSSSRCTCSCAFSSPLVIGQVGKKWPR